MATALAHHHRPAAAGSYHRLLVPLVGGSESARAVEIACSLAAEHGAELTVVYVIEVPTLLPLDARMDDDEITARAAFHQAQAIADSFGLHLRGRKVRAREAGPAIVELAHEFGAEVIVIAAPRKRRAYGRSRFGATVRHVLAKAPCPVLVAAPPAV
jgi:nucleotide-binding universal stress UspA family protein